MSSSRCLLGALLLTFVACDPAPTAPGPAIPDVADARVGSDVVLPMQLQATLTWVVDQSPQAQAACAPRPGVAEGGGQGEATHLGRFRVLVLDHCSIDLAVVPPTLDGAGDFVFEAADGSTMAGSYVFFFAPAELGGFMTLHVQGGSGRFAGATGRLDYVPERSEMAVCVDALCLEGATLEALFQGWIAVPRP